MALISADQQKGFPAASAAPFDLDHPDAEQRRRAVLNYRGQVDCPRLLALLNREQDLSVRQAIFDVLVEDGGKSAVNGLILLLKSEDANLRNEAITALQDLPDAVAPCIDKLLAADDPDVRIFAINILRDLRNQKTIGWLCQVLENDDHANVVGTALDHSMELVNHAMRPAIEQAMARFYSDTYVTFVGNLLLDRLERDLP